MFLELKETTDEVTEEARAKDTTENTAKKRDDHYDHNGKTDEKEEAKTSTNESESEAEESEGENYQADSGSEVWIFRNVLLFSQIRFAL